MPCAAVIAQDDVYRTPRAKKATPTEIHPEIWVLDEQVITVQWPATLELINAPANLAQIEPSQCMRFGVFATGDDRYHTLQSARYQFTVQYAGQTETFGAQPADAVKQIKPEGGDLVTGALAAAGIKNPLPSMASMAGSRARWCMPDGGRDGSVIVAGLATRSDGTTVKLKSRAIDAVTFDSARRKQPAMTPEALSSWIPGYYASPNPALLLPALRLAAGDRTLRSLLNLMQFFVSVLKSSPYAANDLLRTLPSENADVRTYSLALLRRAGYSVESLLASFKDDERAGPQAAELPDAFDLTPDRTLFPKLDMLWSIFFATGEIRPVRSLASMLAWESDYAQVEKARETHRQDPEAKMELTDNMVRAVAYSAAGWSLASLSRREGLVVDYIDAIKAKPDFSGEAKQLADVYTNPAFKRQ